jgi:hypothetical protein
MTLRAKARIINWIMAFCALVLVGTILSFVNRDLHGGVVHPLDRLEAHAMTIHQWQVDGYADPKTDTHAASLKSRLQLAANRLGVKFDPSVTVSPGAVGTYYSDSRTIAVTPTFSLDAYDEIVSHELAHVLQPPRELTHGEEEVFAMSVSYMVVQRARCDGNCELRYATYLAMHKTSLQVMRVYRPEIEFAANFIWGEQ